MRLLCFYDERRTASNCNEMDTCVLPEQAPGSRCSSEIGKSDEGEARGIVWGKSAPGTGSAQYHAAGDRRLDQDWLQRSLQALEDEHFDQLPGGIFNKGFVRAYARCVGLDEEKTLAEYLAAAKVPGPEGDMQALSSQVPLDASCERSLAGERRGHHGHSGRWLWL